jgi:molybdopterin molybdotransferase
VEQTKSGGDSVEIGKAVAAGANIIQPGEDLHRGDAILAAGRRLRPQDLAALAIFGFVELPVFRRPRIALFSTGNELCDPVERPRPGQVREANQSALGAQIAAAGCEPTYAGIVRDDLGALREAVARLLPDHDGLMLSGGSSVGVKDLAGEALRDLPAPGVLFHGIDIRPGKPTLFARAGAKPVVGMPGFPTSALIVFDAFIRPMLQRLGGEDVRDPWPARRRARLSKDQASVAGREDYVRVRLVDRDGALWADPLPGGSSAIANVLFADGLVRIDAAQDRAVAGTEVDVLLYS